MPVWAIVLIIIFGSIFGIFLVLGLIALIKKPSSIYKNKPEERNPMEGKMVEFVYDDNDKENADGVKGHLVAVGDAKPKKKAYFFFKRLFDIILSFGALFILSPLFIVLMLAIVIDDPGPVFFTQKRLGKNKRYFKLHKFRSMKMSTPHDVPTHMLENPEQYITKVGKFIRAHSLDELPQIWDIFIGNMSVIGPRPGLWNQDLLTSERDKYNANNVKPGLTGWAQINGRDELEIPVKAQFDGEYVDRISFGFDCKCFFGSLHVFRKDDSIVEGGTGELKKSIDKDKKMNKMPQFSLLMSVYYKDNPLWLEEAISSVLSSTIVPNQIVIVKDGELNADLENVLHKYSANPLFFITGYETNQGLGKALNYGLRFCNNNLIARMDSDDICNIDRFEKQLSVFLANPEFAIVGSNVSEFTNNPNEVVSIRKVPEFSKEIVNFSKKRNPFNHPSVMFKKDVILSVGGYQDFYRHEDYYLWYRLLFNKFVGYNIQENLVRMRTCEDFYKRRGGTNTFKARVKLEKMMLHDKYISILTFLFVFFANLANLCMPSFLRRLVHKKVLRKRPNEAKE